MRVIKVGDAKNNLSRHLAYVKRGGRVRILQRDTPIADLIPVEPTSVGGSDAAELVRLERLGVLRRGKNVALHAGLLRPGPKASHRLVSETLIKERLSSR